MQSNKWSSLMAWGIATAKRCSIGQARVALCGKPVVVLHRVLCDGFVSHFGNRTELAAAL